MYIERIIKRETLSLVIKVFVIVIFIITFLYLFVFNIEESNKNTKKLDLEFCSDEQCETKYENYNNIIGMDVIDGVSSVRKLNVYSNEKDLIKEKPYIFKINNNISRDIKLSVLLYESDVYSDYYYSNYINYLDYLKISISSCGDNSDMKTYSFKNLKDNILLSDISLQKDKSKIMCMWSYIDSNVVNLNEDVYFIANIDFNY